ncbi:MAG: TIGR00266 family protein [Ruminococcaceae bacterium]|nr:TIGR00266 family protein [Oscillospiraceae bacterium]
MQYKIFGDSLPAVSLRLKAGESVITQSGGMTWMSDQFSMDTNMRGGFGGALGRMITGESLFTATYTARADNAEITFASSFPGSIVALKLDGTKEYICQKNAFLCATSGINLSVAVNRARAGLFGGEGFIMQRLSGTGMVFLEIDGTAVEHQLSAGETLKIDTGNLAIYESTVDYTTETVKGFKNVLFGGEGLFLSVVRGPGKVWLQTMNIHNFVGKISQYMPTKGD